MNFSQQLLQWFSKHGRKDLPWQKNPSAYRVWVSEIMLQQTQVNTVIPYYLKFMEQFPTLEDLANATDEQVMALWSGLGYYSRARNLHKTALLLNAENKCNPSIEYFPNNSEKLQSLPGIGRSTAGAILALAMEKKAAILDGNVKRVLARCFAISGWPGKSSVANKLWELSEQLTPELKIRQYTQAMMDLGATICTRNKPDCINCPLNQKCIANKENKQTAYPGKKKKALIPTKKQNFYLLLNQNQQLLMEKRPPSGIWGGLWTPLSCSTTDDGKLYLQQTYGINIEDEKLLSDFRHTFSHFHLLIQPIKAILVTTDIDISDNNLYWDSIDSWLQRGIPAAVRTMLQQI